MVDVVELASTSRIMSFVHYAQDPLRLPQYLGYTSINGLGGKIRTYELLLPKQAEWTGLSDTEFISKILYILIYYVNHFIFISAMNILMMCRTQRN